MKIKSSPSGARRQPALFAKTAVRACRRGTGLRNPARRHTSALHLCPQPATITDWGSGDAGIWGTRGNIIMAVTRTALKTEPRPNRAGVTLDTFEIGRAHV